jgi:hypothetical protein
VTEFSLEQTLIEVWRQSFVESASILGLDGGRYL